MRHLRLLPLVILGAGLLLPALVPGSASASGVSAKASLLWLQDQAVDDVYAQAQPPVRDLRVQVWHDREDDDAYRRGESLGVHFRTNADVYVVVYRIDVDGLVEVLWPTSRYDDGFVYGNHTYSLPRPGSPVRLTASDRKGVEYVQAIASEYPFDLRELAIDFRFDLDAEYLYDYRISGDPFLAVNDVNYAVTGLEEDVDYVVTDWTHLYVESPVEYARYTCTQCHQGDDGDTYVHPYVDTCTTVNVYSDWNWHRRWYVSFGWYPLYYEPPFYYWDTVYARPYWFSYYPIHYSWYRYPIYVRPYPVYGWHDSPWYAGDYRVRYRKGVTRSGPLYDVASPSTEGRLRRGEARAGSSVPPSIARSTGGRSSNERVDRSQLVRNDRPTRDRRELTPRSGSTDRGRRPGVRQDRDRPTQRRVTSLAPRDRSAVGDRVTPGRGAAPSRERIDADRTRPGRSGAERSWTRPVIRNRDADRPTRGSGVDRTRPSTPRRDTDGRIDRPTRTRPSRDVDSPRRGRSGGDDRIERSRPSRRPEAKPAPRSNPDRRRDVSPPSRPSRGNDRKVAPPSRGGSSGRSKATPSRGGSGGSRGRGGGGDSKSRGGGGRG